MRKLRVGMVGLGDIAKKAYLPIVTKETDWRFVGAFSPNEKNRKVVCDQYRIQEFHSIQSLASECDAVFVHSSTSTHYEIVKYLLQKGIDVYVDKPLASTIHEVEELVELSLKLNRKLMVGFNRRFAPHYVKVKEEAGIIHSIKMEKHRQDSVGPEDYRFTLLDDYIHLIDTLCFLTENQMNFSTGSLILQNEKVLYQAFSLFQFKNSFPLSAYMHRRAGTNLEQLEIITENTLYRVKNLHTLEIEENNTVTTIESSSWDSILKQRGFEGAVHHFIDAVAYDKPLEVDGQTAYETQRLVEKIMKDSIKTIV